jgi:hypothetical protein
MRELTDVLAEEGFSLVPKHFLLKIRELERDAKLQLLDLNMKIADEEYEEELRGERATYASLVAEATRSWELRKEGLIAAMMQEFADLDKVVAFEEEDARKLLLEKDLQMLLLITAKAAIEYEKELLQQQLVALDRLTHAKEIELAEAKLVVAQRKLDLIPKLQTLVTKEQELLVEETKVYNESLNLFPARQALLAKTEEMAGFLARKADARMRLAASLMEQLEVKLQIVAEELTRVGLQKSRVDSEARVSDARDDVQRIANSVDLLQDTVALAGLSNRNTILSQRVQELIRLAGLRTTYYGLAEDWPVTEQGLRSSAATTMTNRDAANAKSVNAFDVADDVNTTLVLAQQDEIATERIAIIQGQAEITSKLVHVLGG